MICHRCLRRGSRGFVQRASYGWRCSNLEACNRRRQRMATFDPVPLITGRHVIGVEEKDDERVRIKLSEDLFIEVYLGHVSPDEAYLDWVVTTNDG